MPILAALSPIASPAALTSLAVSMKALPVAIAAPVAAAIAAPMAAVAPLIAPANFSPNFEPPSSPAFSLASFVTPVSSLVMVACEPSIDGTIVTKARATSMCSAISLLPPKPVTEFVQREGSLSKLPRFIVILSRSRIGFYFRFLLATARKVHEVGIDNLEHVEDIR